VTRTSMVLTRIVLASLPALAACARPLETLRIDGSAGVAPLVSALVTEYQSRHPSALIVMASGLGSSARLKALEEGRIDLAMASHGVDSADLVRRELVAHRIARTAVVFAVHTSVPVTAISSRQLCDIFAGRVRNWRDLGGPDLIIQAATRPKGEVDADVAHEGIACLRESTPGADVKVIERPDEMTRVLSATTGAIGLTSAPMVEQSAGRLRSLTLNGVTPSVENVVAGSYPLSREAILVHRTTMPRSVEEFLAFVRSADGERVIRANGAVPSK
jgi:phosphate transport system substrate-binding protein